MFQSRKDYYVPLLQLLDSLPGRQGTTRAVLDKFGDAYRDQILPRDYLKNDTGNIRWEWSVRWTRQKLVELGLMDSPQHGVWRLADEGHRWLQEHPQATRLSDAGRGKRQRTRKTRSTAERRTKRARGQRYSAFFRAVQASLDAVMPREVKSLSPEIETRVNRFLLRLAGFRGCHYEVHLGREYHEISIRFHSSQHHVNEAHRQAYEPHLAQLSAALGHPVLAEVFGSDQNRTRVWLRLPVAPPTEALAQHYGTLAGRFIEETFPTLKSIYADRIGRRRRRIARAGTTPLDGHHLILDREIEAIRAFLDGRSDQRPSDEKLCDWVQFCYTFGLYAEGRDLFRLIEPSQVNDWYYVRTRKIADICKLRTG